MTIPVSTPGSLTPYAFLPLILTKQNGGLLGVDVKGIVLG